MTTEGFIFLQRSAKVNASLRSTARLVGVLETVTDLEVAAAEAQAQDVETELTERDEAHNVNESAGGRAAKRASRRNER